MHNGQESGSWRPSSRKRLECERFIAALVAARCENRSDTATAVLKHTHSKRWREGSTTKPLTEPVLNQQARPHANERIVDFAPPTQALVVADVGPLKSRNVVVNPARLNQQADEGVT